MKKLYPLLCLLFCANSVFSQIPTSGLIAWYPFCGNALDKSGNGNDLTVSGPTLTVDRFGNANCAYYFNGNEALLSNILYRTPPLPTDGKDFTYSIWFRLDTSGNMAIMANGNLNYDGYEMLITGPIIYSTGHDVAGLLGNVGFYLVTYVSFHEWHNSILRRTGSTYDLILDTINLGSFTETCYPTSSSEDFAIGQDYSNGTNPFIGALDDAAVYNRALTNLEIRQLYHYNPDALISLGNDTSFCSGSITLNSSPQPPGTTYLWSTSSTDTSITISKSGIYTLSVTNAYGCVAIDTINVAVNKININAGNDQQICMGNTTALHASGAEYYKWNPSSSLSCNTCATPIASPLTTTTYILTGTDSGGCVGTDTVTISISPSPVLSVQRATRTNCSSQNIQLNASGAIKYMWSPGKYLNDSTLVNPTATAQENSVTYYVTATSKDGCTSYDSVIVLPFKQPTAGFPSAFSPNGDGTNDILYVRGSNVAMIDMAIYNRWGQKVFETKDINKGWDGSFNGIPQPLDTYSCILKITTLDGCITTKAGNITLLK